MQKRRSIQLLDLESRLEQITAENRQLRDLVNRSGHDFEDINNRQYAEAIASRDTLIQQKDAEIENLRSLLELAKQDIENLTDGATNQAEPSRELQAETDDRVAVLQSESVYAHQQWVEASTALKDLQRRHDDLASGVERIVREEIRTALEEKTGEVHRLREELDTAIQRTQALQHQVLASQRLEGFLTFRDEDYFDSACQQLCQHVQQWVTSFSKFSDNHVCRPTSDLVDEKIETRLDNAVLDGTDVDALLASRVKRRDVFMSVVMTLVWEFIFTRYLFGLDQDQRRKLKSLEKNLVEVGMYSFMNRLGKQSVHIADYCIGPTTAVAQWRAITLTLLSQREAYLDQREQDTDAVVQEIFDTLSALLPPPLDLENQIFTSLRNVVRLAVDISVEMRTQRAEYIMLPPLQPEYDENGDLARKVFFNPALMNERSGESFLSSEYDQAVVRIVLFPLVVKKGDNFGEGDDEIVVWPAQVLVARPDPEKVARVVSGNMDIDGPIVSEAARQVVGVDLADEDYV